MKHSRFVGQSSDYFVLDRVDDEFNPNQPRGKGAQGGQWVKTIHSSPVQGTTAERLALRKALKDETDPEKREQIKQKILDSFVKQYNKKPSAELEAKIAKYSKLYGKPNPLKELNKASTPSFMKPVVPGFTPSGEVIPKAPSFDPPPGVTFSAEEVAAYKNLSEISGSQETAKSWLKAGEQRRGKIPGADLSKVEAAHIVAYSGNAYKKTNAQLRSGQLDPATYRHSKQLEKALSKLPAYDGTVYRKADLTEAQFSKYKTGSVTIERGFTSSSTEMGTWSGSYKYQIKSKTGRNITQLSSHPGENEVLFLPNTGFRVTKVSGNVIYMEEFDE